MERLGLGFHGVNCSVCSLEGLEGQDRSPDHGSRVGRGFRAWGPIACGLELVEQLWYVLLRGAPLCPAGHCPACCSPLLTLLPVSCG